MSETVTVSEMTITHLPGMILEMILSYLSYDEIAKSRIVCRIFNEICKQMLNRGSKLIEKSCNEYLNIVKSQLPRRESEKNSHPLLPSYIVLNSIKTSLCRLSLVYDEFIQANLCCFIPGKIIDEVVKIFQIIKNQKGRENSVTFLNLQVIMKEFNDIRGLAIEHFEDNIKPIFDRRVQNDTVSVSYDADLKFYESKRGHLYNAIKSSYSNSDESFGTYKNSCGNNKASGTSLQNFDLIIPEYSKKMQDFVKTIENQELKMRDYVDKLEKQESKMNEYAKKIQDQDVKMQEYSKKIQTQDSKIREYAEKIRNQELSVKEYSRKFQNQDAQLAQMSKSLDGLNKKLRNVGTGLIQD